MDIFSAIASVNAFIIAFLIFRKKQKSTSDYILIAWVINFALHFLVPFGIERQVFFHNSVWGLLMGIFVVAHAPFIFIYTRSLTDPEFKVNFRNFYHFGFILLFIISFLPYLGLSPDARMELAQEKENLSYYMLLPMLLLLIIRIYFLVRSIILLIKHQYRIKQSFSYESKINLSWLKLMVYGFMGVIVISFILYGLVSAQIISVFQMDYILISINIILFFFIVYSGYNQKAIKQILPTSISVSTNVNNSNNTETEFQHPQTVSVKDTNPVIENLLQFMEMEKPYLDPELNIGTIANQLNIHAHKLSKLINVQLKKNFFEFINEYRVEEFKKLATNPKNKHISILGLAFDAGFNSKATFYRFFKNSTGLTPTEFMESYKF